MASRPALDLWLYDTPIGSLSEPSYGRMRLTFTAEAEDRFGPGAVTLSISMPVNSRQRPRGDRVSAFFDGLLPEGHAEVRIAQTFNVRRGDAFGLLSAIGRDCAGAIVLQPADEPPPGERGVMRRLDDDDFADLVRHVRDRPLGAGDDVRVSLAGAQDKILLAATGEGWALPAHGAPSTHIAKPQDLRLAGYADGEAFCLALARLIDLTNVDATVEDIGGRPVLIVSRYDRTTDDGGRVHRLHQEDCCQALAISTSLRDRKYESDGGPSLRAVAGLLAQFARPVDRIRLLALTVLNVIIGNADAHGKNISMMHLRDGTTTLAPGYDLTPVTFYRAVPTEEGLRPMSDRLGMRINGKTSIHEITVDDLIAEGSRWSLPESRVRTTVTETLERVRGAVDEAMAVAGPPGEMCAFVTERVEALLAGRPAAAFE